MKLPTSLLAASVATLLLVLPLQIARSAQDHNSSRSNKTASIAAPMVVENLLDLTRADGSAMARAMIEYDQRDGYAGDYEITVSVAVSVKRVPAR